MNKMLKTLCLCLIIAGITTTIQALRKKVSDDEKQKTELNPTIKLAKKIANTRRTIKALWASYKILKNKENSKTLNVQEKKALKSKRIKYFTRTVALSRKLSQMEDEFKKLVQETKATESVYVEATPDREKTESAPVKETEQPNPAPLAE